MLNISVMIMTRKNVTYVALLRLEFCAVAIIAVRKNSGRDARLWAATEYRRPTPLSPEI